MRLLRPCKLCLCLASVGARILIASDALATAPCFDYALISRTISTGSCAGVSVADDRAYIAAGQTLRVYDVSSPALPRFRGLVELPAQAYDVAVAGTRAYVAVSTAGLYVVDVSNPLDMAVVGHIDTPGDARDVEVAGTRAYVADRGEFLVVDITNPAAPAVMGLVDPAGDCVAVALAGSIAYVAATTSGLLVVDVSQPAAPTVVSQLSAGEPQAVAKVDQTLFLAGSPTLTTVDISMPTAPVVLGNYNAGSYGTAVAGFGAYALVGTASPRVEVIDVSNLGAPQLVRWADLPSFTVVGGIVIVGQQHAYLANSGSGLKILDISNPRPPVLGQTATLGYATGVASATTLACVTEDVAGMEVVDVTDSSHPVTLGSVDTPGAASSVDIAGTHAYVADGVAGLQIVDFSNPRAPIVVGNVPTPGDAFDVKVSSGFAYITDGALQVVDISNPSAPVITGSTDTPGRAARLALAGNRAYIADLEGGLQVVDITDPAAPQILGGALGVAVAEEAALSGTRAYVASHSGLRVVDVSNPANPVELTEVAASSYVSRVLVSGDYAYVSIRDLGLSIYRISSPVPTLVATLISPPQVAGAFVLGSRLFVAAGTDGFWILPGECATTTDVEVGPRTGTYVLRAWPNPSASGTTMHFATTRPDRVRLQLFDVRGRLIRRLVETWVPAGHHTLTWDGRDERGRPVASGAYMARLIGPDGTATVRISLLRPAP